VTVTLLVALGAILAAAGDGVGNFESLLFGDPLAASGRDLVVAGVLAVVIAATLFFFEDQFSALAFDAGVAPSLGVNTAVVSAAALGLLTLSVAVAANVAGSLLALTLVTGPALGASALTSRLLPSIYLSAFAGAACGVIGIYVSYYADQPASASVALVICAWAAVASAVGAARR
jgi:manganese transport system permease protein